MCVFVCRSQFQEKCPTEEINYDSRKKINGKNFHLDPAAGIDDDYYCRCQCQGDNVVVDGSIDAAAAAAERRDTTVGDRRTVRLLCNFCIAARKNNDERSISRCILLFVGALCQQGTLHSGGNFITTSMDSEWVWIVVFHLSPHKWICLWH